MKLLRAPDGRPRVSLGAVEGSALVRIFTVAQVLYFRNLNVDGSTPAHGFLVLVDRGKIIRNGAVVTRGVLKGFAAETKMRRWREGASVFFELGKYGAVVLGIDNHADLGMILRRGANHARTADVDVFDDLFK